MTIQTQTATLVAPRGGRPRSRTDRLNARLGVVYALPTGAMVAVFFLIPLALCLWMSLNDWPLIGASSPNGVQNYEVLADPLVLKAAGFTLVYTIITTIVLGVTSFALALLVQSKKAGVGFFRTVFFMPTALGLASTSLLFLAFFSSQVGPLDGITRFLGFGTIDWLGTPEMALLSTVGMVTWRFAGFYMLILLTGLQAIPAEVYEAARVDGANWWHTFRSVTIPLMRPSIALMLVLSITGSVLAFEQFYILTGGGPDNSTITLVMALYRQAFVLFDLGKASAIGIALLLFLVVLNGLQLLLLRQPKEDR
jgi:multiple sugar transport system permease protein